MKYFEDKLTNWLDNHMSDRISNTCFNMWSDEPSKRERFKLSFNDTRFRTVNERNARITTASASCKLETNIGVLTFDAIGISTKSANDKNDTKFGRNLALKRLQKSAYQFAERFLNKYFELLQDECFKTSDTQVIFNHIKDNAKQSITDMIQH